MEDVQDHPAEEAEVITKKVKIIRKRNGSFKTSKEDNRTHFGSQNMC